MPRQDINIGATGNDGTGDSIREAFSKTNENFQELYAAQGLEGGLAFESLNNVLKPLQNRGILTVKVNSNSTIGVENRVLESGDSFVEINYDTPGKILINAGQVSIERDPEPTLANNLNANSNRIYNLLDPEQDQQAATQQWVYNNFLNRDSTFVTNLVSTLQGSTMRQNFLIDPTPNNGNLNLTPGNSTIRIKGADGITDKFVDLNKQAVEDGHAVRKDYADTKISLAGTNTIDPRTGAINAGAGTMTGPLILFRDPVRDDPQRLAATKGYVDARTYHSPNNLYVSTIGRDDLLLYDTNGVPYSNPVYGIPLDEIGRNYSKAFKSVRAAAKYSTYLMSVVELTTTPYQIPASSVKRYNPPFSTGISSRVHITIQNHGYIEGDYVKISGAINTSGSGGADTTALNGVFRVHTLVNARGVIDPNNFEVDLINPILWAQPVTAPGGTISVLLANRKDGPYTTHSKTGRGYSVRKREITILVEAGVYDEELPIRIPANTAVKGDEFRRTIIRPKYGPSPAENADFVFTRGDRSLNYRYWQSNHYHRQLAKVSVATALTTTLTVYDAAYLPKENLRFYINNNQYRIKNVSFIDPKVTPGTLPGTYTMDVVDDNGDPKPLEATIISGLDIEFFLDNDHCDMFLVDDGFQLRNISGYGHRGFMLALDPAGQILTRSPYGQVCASFSKPGGGGELIDGACGNQVCFVQDTSYSDGQGGFGASGTQITVTGLIRPIQLPNTFYYFKKKYIILKATTPDANGTSTLTLDESTPIEQDDTYLPAGFIPNGQQLPIETAGNRSMLANDFTMVNDLGYGIVADNNGVSEQVSTFSYYNKISYWAKNGAQIRSTMGSSCYGEIGLQAEGSDLNEALQAARIGHDIVNIGTPLVDDPTAEGAVGSVSLIIGGVNYPPVRNTTFTLDKFYVNISNIKRARNQANAVTPDPLIVTTQHVHPFATGQVVKFSQNIGGLEMPPLTPGGNTRLNNISNNSFLITVVDQFHFTLNGTNSQDYLSDSTSYTQADTLPFVEAINIANAKADIYTIKGDPGDIQFTGFPRFDGSVGENTTLSNVLKVYSLGYPAVKGMKFRLDNSTPVLAEDDLQEYKVTAVTKKVVKFQCVPIIASDNKIGNTTITIKNVTAGWTPKPGWSFQLLDSNIANLNYQRYQVNTVTAEGGGIYTLALNVPLSVNIPDQEIADVYTTVDGIWDLTLDRNLKVNITNSVTPATIYFYNGYFNCSINPPLNDAIGQGKPLLLYMQNSIRAQQVIDSPTIILSSALKFPDTGFDKLTYRIIGKNKGSKTKEVFPIVAQAEPIATGYTNVSTLLNANKSFIQAEAQAFIDAELNGFEYDQVKCSRDVGLILDAVINDLSRGGNQQVIDAASRYWSIGGNSVPYDQAKCKRDVDLILKATLADAVFGSNYQSTKAGLAYLRSYSSNVTQYQKDQTITGINKARDLAVDLVADQTTKTKITNNFAIVTSIINNGAGVAPNLTYPSPTGVDVSVERARDILIANKAYLRGEVIGYITDNLDPNNIPNYNSTTCSRDVGYVIDALIYDLTYGGNSQTLDAALSYYYNNVNVSPGEITATVSAYTHLQTVIQQVIQNQVVASSSSNAEIQDVSLPAGTVTEANTVRDLIGTTILVVEANGPGSAPSQVLPTFTAGNSTAQSARSTVLASSTVIQDDVITYLNSTLATVIPGQVSQTAAAVAYLKQVASSVVTNTLFTGYQTNIPQITDNANPGSNASAAIVGNFHDIISDVISNSPTAAPAIIQNGTVSNDPGVVNAVNLLLANKEYLKAETIAFINSNYFIYDKAKSRRDIGYAVNAVIYDLTYGGNSQAINAGSKFWASGLTLIPGKITECVASVNYAKNLAIDVINNRDPQTLYQNTIVQVKNAGLPPESGADSAIATEMDIIASIMQFGTNAAPPVVSPSNLVQTLEFPATANMLIYGGEVSGPGIPNPVDLQDTTPKTIIRASYFNAQTNRYVAKISATLTQTLPVGTEITVEGPGYDFIFDLNSAMDPSHMYGERAGITTTFSTVRATGHDFLQVGAGGFDDSNYPQNIWGQPVGTVSASKITKEVDKGRVFHMSTDQEGNFRVGTFFEVNQGDGSVSLQAKINLTNINGLQFTSGVLVKQFSADGKMSDNADYIVPTQQAVVTYIESLIKGRFPDNTLTVHRGLLRLDGASQMVGNIKMGGNEIEGLNNSVNDTGAVNKKYVDNAFAGGDIDYEGINPTSVSSVRTNVRAFTMKTDELGNAGKPADLGAIDANNNRIKNVRPAVETGDATSKGYVDQAIATGGQRTGWNGFTMSNVVSRRITNPVVTEPGAGYSAEPPVTVTGGNGTGAVLKAVVTGGAVTGLQVLDGGTGYTTDPTVVIGGAVSTLTIAAGGAFAVVPTLTFPLPDDAGGVRATATCTLDANGKINKVTLTNAGSGYTSVPAVVISNQGTGATATATINPQGQISGVDIVDGGTGYDEPPLITVLGGGGSGSLITSTIDGNGAVSTLSIISGGVGFTEVPRIVIGAAVDATLTPGSGATGTVDIELISNNINLNTNKLTNVADPTTSSDGANKNYVDNNRYISRLQDVTVTSTPTNNEFLVFTGANGQGVDPARNMVNVKANIIDLTALGGSDNSTGSHIGFTRTGNSINIQIQPGAIIDSMVRPTAGIAQSKLSLNAANNTLTNVATTPTQDQLGVATFLNSQFNSNGGLISIKTATDSSTGLSPSTLSHISNFTVLGRYDSSAGENVFGAVRALSSTDLAGVLDLTTRIRAVVTDSILDAPTGVGTNYGAVMKSGSTMRGPLVFQKKLQNGSDDTVSSGPMITVGNDGSSGLYDIGSSTRKFRNIYCSNIIADSITGGASQPDVAGRVSNPFSKGQGVTFLRNSDGQEVPSFDGSSAVTIIADSSETSVPNKLVMRDSSSNVKAAKFQATTGFEVAGTGAAYQSTFFPIIEESSIGGNRFTKILRRNYDEAGGPTSGILIGGNGNPRNFYYADRHIFRTYANQTTADSSGGNPPVGDAWIESANATYHGYAINAYYADVAEKYTSDSDYEPGTVVEFGGEFEVTQTTTAGSRKIAGVISTNPALLMNKELTEGAVAVALVGRVPTKVVGKIRKGDMLVASDIPGVATASDDPQLGSIIGKALADYDSADVGIIEVVIGKQ